MATAAVSAPADEAARALAAGDFGRANEIAAAAARQSPGDAQLQLLHARTAARLGNTGESVRALEAALAAGLSAPAQAVTAADFDGVREDGAFRRFTAALGPAPQPAGRPRSRPRPAGDVIRAGDVEITDDAIRAGDITLKDE